jgi:hypothetical protein
LLLGVLAAASLLLASCSRGSPISGTVSPTAQATASVPAGSVAGLPDEERQWAAQALRVLDTVNAGVEEFHASTAAPAGSSQSYQLRQTAYATLQQALNTYQQMLPATESLQDSALRDQFMFVMGNIGGFLNPTPDLPGDPPTLGDRIGRSLENAITASAALRPKLQKVAQAG